MSVFDRQEWLNAVGDLKQKAARFLDLYSRVRSSNPQSDALAEKKSILLSRGNTTQTTISKATQAIDYVYSKWDEIFGDEQDDTLQDLGVVWFITVPVLAGISATLVYLITDYSQYLGENERVEQLRNEGYSTREALDIVNRPTGIAAGIESALKSYGPWLAAGLVAYLIIRT